MMRDPERDDGGAREREHPKPTPPEGGWKPPSETPYVEGVPLMAWVSWKMQGAGFDEEDALAGLVVEAASVAREMDDGKHLVWAIEGAVRQLTATAPAPSEPGEEKADGKVLRCRSCGEVFGHDDHVHDFVWTEEEDEDDCTCDGDNLALQVLCRVFDDDPADVIEEWRAFDKSGWLWWGRALGAFIRGRLAAPTPKADG